MPVRADVGISILFFLSIRSYSIRFVPGWIPEIIRFNPPNMGELVDSLSKTASHRQGPAVSSRLVLKHTKLCASALKPKICQKL
jgi:hypothetical protein